MKAGFSDLIAAGLPGHTAHLLTACVSYIPVLLDGAAWERFAGLAPDLRSLQRWALKKVVPDEVLDLFRAARAEVIG